MSELRFQGHLNNGQAAPSLSLVPLTFLNSAVMEFRQPLGLSLLICVLGKKLPASQDEMMCIE